MKKIFAYISLFLTVIACTNDDNYSWDNFVDKTATDTIRINIVYNGTSVNVTGDNYGFVTTNGADVTVKSSTNSFLQLVLSGESNDGSLLIYSWRKNGVLLNGLTLTNADGPAINNQCGKSFYVTSAEGTTNTLTDGTTYSAAPTNAKGDTIDQKATLFSEGQIYFNGTGMLNINGNAKNGVASDDYVTFESSTITINVSETGSNGIKANDGVFIKGGTLNILVKADGARGIKNDACTTISGGNTTITTTGKRKIESVNGIADTTTCAGIKSDSLFLMTDGILNITSTGYAGKGINCSQAFEQTGGKLIITTIGIPSSKPHGIKADGNIIISGGEAYVVTKRKAFSTDAKFLINGGTVMGIGTKESKNEGSQNSQTISDVDVEGNETVSYCGVSYTIPSIYSCDETYILVSKSGM